MMNDKEKVSSRSAIFIGNRVLGKVCDHVPLVTRYIEKRREHLIACSVGRIFHTYGGAKLGLLSTSGIHPSDITCLAGDTYHIYAASGTDIYAWRRGTELKHRYKGHSKPIHSMLTLGPYLISVDDDSHMIVWNIKSEEKVADHEFKKQKFKITAIVHPQPYLNKILLGSSKGFLEVWNIQRMERVNKKKFQSFNSLITCLEDAPAIDVVAVGLKSGEIIVHNIKVDQTLIKFRQDWGSVTALTFRKDLPPGQAMLISASPAGHMALWDLEERKLAVQMRDVHAAGITGVQCLPSEPLMVTSSPDNTLKQWIFDMPDGGGRLLRIKEAHSAPPTKIRFYGSSGDNILSAGEDSSLRSFSTITELLNKSFGVASYNRKLSKKHNKMSNPVKMEPIIDFTTETTRDKDWDNVACIHRDTTIATTWSFGKQCMGSLQLRHERFKRDKSLRDVKASCICLTLCGNFVLIGYDSGHVDKYNIQSGILRGSYQAQGFDEAHPKRKIRGICTDGLNQLVVTGDHKGGLKYWQFSTCKFLARASLDCELVQLEMHRDSSLLAVALQDFSIILLDAITRKTVRKFFGHDNQITDMSFSADSRWLLSSSLDGTVKAWDIPTGHLVDHFRFATSVTSLTLSPRGDFLATCHAGDLGIYLWNNMTLFSHVSLKALPEDNIPYDVALPISSQLKLESIKEDEEDQLPMEIDQEYQSPSQLHSDLVTLENLPSSRWQNLLKLDVIRARNKPKDAVKKPQEAPFFLPTVQGINTKFDLESSDKSSNLNPDSTKSQIIQSSILAVSEFGNSLLQAELPEDFKAVMAILMEKGPSAIDLELTNLSPENGGSLELMSQFLQLILTILKLRCHFEAVQAYLALFMKLHSDAIMTQPELSNLLAEILHEQEQVWKSLECKLSTSATLVGYYKQC